MGKLTTHVLDTFHGRPAEGIRIDLSRVDGVARALKSERTRSDGRCAAPLLEGATLERGEYELAFHLADYFRATGVTLPDPPFLDIVRIRIGIADPGASYHVPLVATPWSYSTYRGS
jgi:5-hydroxyisourate hydrolase